MVRTLATIAFALCMSASCAPAVPTPTTESPAPLSLAPSQAPTSPARTSQTAAVDWAALARAYRGPELGPDSPCPRSTGREVASAFGPALGDGPVYPVGLGSDGVLHVVDRDGAWLQKVLWVSAGSYAGPILVRGRALDGAEVVELAVGDTAFTDQLRLVEATTISAGEPAGWRQWPSYTRVTRPGCYAYQVDGTSFSTVIVFEAVAGN